MPSLAGKKTRISVCTTLGGTYTLVAGLDTAGLEIDGAEISDNEFGVDWNERVMGLKDTKITLSGAYRPDDTTGQVLIRSSLIGDTPLFVKFLPDNGVTANAGLNVQVIVTKFAVDDAVADLSKVSIELQGTGAATLV